MIKTLKTTHNHLKAAQTQLHINKFLALNGKDRKKNSHRVEKLKYNNTPIKNSPQSKQQMEEIVEETGNRFFSSWYEIYFSTLPDAL